MQTRHTTPTLAVSGLTAHTIVKAGGAVAANDLITTVQACANYDPTGTQFELINPQTSSGGTYTPPVTTKGDLFGYSTVPARIPIGTDTFIMTADSGQSLGLKWAPLTAAQIPAVNLPTPGATCTFTANSTYCVCTTTCTITVPVPAAGYQFCAANDDNVSTVITMSAIGSSARYEATARTGYGTAGTGTFVSGGAVGDFACLLGRDSTHYLTLSSKGTWVAN